MNYCSCVDFTRVRTLTPEPMRAHSRGVTLGVGFSWHPGCRKSSYISNILEGNGVVLIAGYMHGFGRRVNGRVHSSIGTLCQRHDCASGVISCLDRLLPEHQRACAWARCARVRDREGLQNVQRLIRRRPGEWQLWYSLI